ncbi:MAG TPA: class I SAM-dependent methyltransferase [Gemmataceae bacterium]|nr:class I SAM-dependent methyltransferase [Gemmataceae bacterium]
MSGSTIVEQRALQSAGVSAAPIYRLVARILSDRCAGGTLLDVGCGRGDLWPHLAGQFTEYHGADVIPYDEFPDGGRFHQVDLDTGRVGLPDGFADVVVAVETIEHLENPRAFARELTRLARPGGWMLMTTPNQLSVLSKLTLSARHEFSAFRAGSYPAHLTALLEVDLRRIAAECAWADVAVEYTGDGRVPGSARHWPRWLSRHWPRELSDNVAIVGRKPGAG